MSKLAMKERAIAVAVAMLEAGREADRKGSYAHQSKGHAIRWLMQQADFSDRWGPTPDFSDGGITRAEYNAMVRRAINGDHAAYLAWMSGDKLPGAHP